MDKEQAVASRKRVFDLVAADRIPFTGYHMPFPAVGYVEKQDLGYRYVPASYYRLFHSAGHRRRRRHFPMALARHHSMVR
jgi:hypothetical protein